MRGSHRYARGDRAKAQCPICGLVVAYSALRADWKKQWVCGECWDPFPPQDRPARAFDAVALHHPRPLQDVGLTVTPVNRIAVVATFAVGEFTAVAE